ncbi:MAG: hypothetical protein ACJ74W_02505 [Pyrinomonadaceae bacterium]
MPTNQPAVASAKGEIEKFYETFNTLPKLIGDLGIDIAEAQRRLDQNYLEDLAAFAKVVHEVIKGDITVEQYLSLFKAMAPSRYQFTETAIEVRADLQTASAQELKLGVDVGIKTAVFSVAVNVSYLKRSASDYQAAAVIRTVLNAVPADPGLLDKLLARGGEPPTVTLDGEPRYRALAEAFNNLPKQPMTSPLSPPHV